MSDIHFIIGFTNDEHRIYAKCIKYQTLEYSVISTSYSFLSLAVIERNHINHFMEAMKLFHSTCDNTNRMYMIHNYDINGSSLDIYKILVMHQGYNVDDCWKGTLIIFDSQSLASCKDTIDFMKAYVRGKPSHAATQDKFDLQLSMQMHMFLLHYTSELPRLKNFNSMNRTTHLVCGYENINFEDIYAPCGFYKIEDNDERVTYIPTIQDIFIDKLPLFILDIETVADDMNTVPIGVTRDQRISSLVLKVIYFDVKIYYILYLCESFENEAKKFNDAFTKRYTDEANNIFIHINSFKTDKLLLESFIQLYSTGHILKMLTGDKNYPHILTGHNILEYDFQVMANIMKRHGMHSLFDNNVTIENTHRPPIVVRFHRSAIILDLFQVAKRNMLSAVGYSLKAMAKAASSDDDQQKYDLNSVNIRKFYILEKLISNDVERQQLAKCFKLQPNVEQSLRIVSSTKEHNFNDIQFDSIRLDENNFKNASIKVRVLDSLEKILIYNMTDCSAVGNILRSNNYFNLVIAFSKMFNMDMEPACYFGNSARLKSCIQSQQINFHHFFGITDRTNHVLILPSTDKFLQGAALESQDSRVVPAITWNSTSTVKAYAGALNYAKTGLMQRVFGIDFVSYYPNLLCARQMSMHRISQVTSSCLLGVPQIGFLDGLVRNGIVTLYCAEDINPEKSLTLSYRGREIAHRLSMDDLETYNHLTNGEGKVILYVENSQPDALYRIAQSLLARRGSAKKQLKTTKEKIKSLDETIKALQTAQTATPTTVENQTSFATQISNIKKEIDHLHKLKNVQDATQLCLKIVVNSLYGVYGANNFAYSHVPIAALITLLGRAKLSLCSRLAVYYYYMEILTNPVYDNKCVYIEDFEQKQIKAVRNLAGRYVTLSVLDEHFKYLCEIAPFANTNEKILSNFSESPEEPPECEPFLDSDIIIYTDTDGILFTNFLDIDCDIVLDNINKFIVEKFPTNCLILEADKKYDVIGILGKKAYFMANASREVSLVKTINCASIPTEAQIQEYFQKIKCKHNGYERNAPLHIKRIYNYIVALVFICNKFEVSVNLLQVFFDIFSYMKLQNQYSLSVQIPLNEHAEKTSNLAQYIERNTTTYKGSVETMFILDTKNIALDCYRTLIEWETNQVPIHYVKTMKTHFKSFWRILNMCKFNLRTTKFLTSNSELLIKKMQHYANLMYCMWGKFPGESAGMKHFQTYFEPENMIYEKSLPCRDNTTSDDICTKRRSHEVSSFSYDIDSFELPSFLCKKIQDSITAKQCVERMDFDDNNIW